MNEAIKIQWAEALESGKFPQGRGRLRRQRADGTYEYCCLGVLCELSGVGTWREDNTYIVVHPGLRSTDDFSESYLPKGVQEWAGLSSQDPSIQLSPGQFISTLASQNDNRMPFDKIAQLIREQL